MTVDAVVCGKDANTCCHLLSFLNIESNRCKPKAAVLNKGSKDEFQCPL